MGNNSKHNKRQVRKTTASTSSSVSTRTTTAPQVEAFNPDYSFVKKDLRRIGTLAGIFLSILVILTFFLR
jgi:hypothetical protein